MTNEVWCHCTKCYTQQALEDQRLWGFWTKKPLVLCSSSESPSCRIVYAMSFCSIWRSLLHFLFSSSESTYTVIKSVLLVSDAGLLLFPEHIPLEQRCLCWEAWKEKGKFYVLYMKGKGEVPSGNGLRLVRSVLPCRDDSPPPAPVEYAGEFRH